MPSRKKLGIFFNMYVFFGKKACKLPENRYNQDNLVDDDLIIFGKFNITEARMTKSKHSKEEEYRLLCEKVVNESWSTVGKYTDEIDKALEKDILDEKDITLLRAAAQAFVQRSILEKIDSVALFGVDLDTE